MKTTFSEKLVAYLALISGLSISAVAVYYSVVGLTSIFSAAAIPIIIMGTSLEISKLIATVWLKQNWGSAPRSIKAYLVAAVVVLMLITSMGIFGFLSKAHSDQSLVSGDVTAKIAIYDEKIKTEKDNIDANRKALKQLDEAVDQVMARSQDEKGADKAVAIRRAQQKDRSRISQEITESQKKISALNDERAPIAAEVRKVEAEVGPIKYIAAFFYGSTDPTVLERAVTWVIITLIVVFDPLAVILLLASQISFQKFRERDELTEDPELGIREELEELQRELTIAELDTNVGEKPTGEELKEIDNDSDPIACYKCGTELINAPGIGPFCPNKDCDVFDNTSGEPIEFITPEGLTTPVNIYREMAPLSVRINDNVIEEPPFVLTNSKSEDNIPLAEVVPTPPTPIEAKEESRIFKTKIFGPPKTPSETYVQNEEQQESNLWSNTVANDHEEYLASTQEELNQQIEELVPKVRAGEIKIQDIPETIRDAIISRV